MLLPLSTFGADFIKGLESFSLTPYKDGSGYSIGYGHYIKAGEESTLMKGITKEKADELFFADTQQIQRTLLVSVPLTQNQSDALTSLIYNIGLGAFERSSLRTVINSGGDVASEWRRWIYAGSEPLQGLRNRREAELALWYKAPSLIATNNLVPVIVVVGLTLLILLS